MTTAANLSRALYRAPFFMDDPGDAKYVSFDTNFSILALRTGAGAQTRIINAPTKSGIRAAICVDVAGGGACTITFTGGYNQDGDTTVAFTEAGDMVDMVSVKIGTTYRWQLTSSAGVAGTGGSTIDIHPITAGAVPDVADLVAYSDESATGDPTLAATVTQLLTAAGDLTDLGAVPAVDDRILLTDESASGDPAKSTTVENLFSALGDVTALAAAPATDDLMVCTDESASGDPIKAITVAQLFQTYFNNMTEGSGITGGVNTTCEHAIEKVGGLIRTTILVDLTGLNSGGTDADIIGKQGGTANCHIGQITAALNGTIFAGSMTCLEVPTGGSDDVNLSSSTVATGAEDAAVSALAGYAALVDAGGAWTLMLAKPLTAFPAADTYLYLSGNSGDATYTAGIFKIELWGK